MANGFAVKRKRTERGICGFLCSLALNLKCCERYRRTDQPDGRGTDGCLVDKLRKGKIKWNSGFDGEYGTIDRV